MHHVYDLSSSIALAHQGGGSGVGGTSDKKGEADRDLAEKLLRDCLFMEPLNSMYWNALGIYYCHYKIMPLLSSITLIFISSLKSLISGIVYKDTFKRQHCFVRSCQLDNNHYAWNNLGMLYLEEKKIVSCSPCVILLVNPISCIRFLVE